MNKNKFLKILMFISVLGIFVFMEKRVSAIPYESIINELLDARGSLSDDVGKYQDEMFNYGERYNIEATIKSSRQYQNFMKIHGKYLGKDINQDSVMFIFIIQYVKDYESPKSLKNECKIKEFIIKSLLSKRSREEGRWDKIVSKLYQKTYGGSLGDEFISRYKDLAISQKKRK